MLLQLGKACLGVAGCVCGACIGKVKAWRPIVLVAEGGRLGDCVAKVTSPQCVPSSQHLQGLRAEAATRLTADKPGSSCPLPVDTSPPDLACKHYLFWKATALFSNKTLGHAVLDFPDLTLT